MLLISSVFFIYFKINISGVLRDCGKGYVYSVIRDLKQRRRRRQGRRLEKYEFIFYRRISHMPESVQCVYRSQNLLKLNMQCQRTIPKENTKNKPPSLTFSKIPRTWSFHVVVLQRTAIYRSSREFSGLTPHAAPTNIVHYNVSIYEIIHIFELRL